MVSRQMCRLTALCGTQRTHEAASRVELVVNPDWETEDLALLDADGDEVLYERPSWQNVLLDVGQIEERLVAAVAGAAVEMSGVAVDVRRRREERRAWRDLQSSRGSSPSLWA